MILLLLKAYKIEKKLSHSKVNIINITSVVRESHVVSCKISHIGKLRKAYILSGGMSFVVNQQAYGNEILIHKRSRSILRNV